MKQEVLQIPFSSINKERVSFNLKYTCPDEPISGIAVCHEPLSVVCDITALDNGFLADTVVRGEVIFFCGRCGSEFPGRIEGTVQTYFTTDREECEEGGEESEIRYISPEADALDISQDVWDAIVLSLPSTPLCRLECRGLCQRCGVNLNKTSCRCSGKDNDSRWDGLKNIKFNTKE